MRARIGIDATRLVSRRTGIENFIYHLLLGLPDVIGKMPHVDVLVFVKAAMAESLSAQISSDRVHLIPLATSHPVLCEQVGLPLWLLKSRVALDLLHSPGFPIAPWTLASDVFVTVHDVVFKSMPETLTAGSRYYWQILFPMMMRRAKMIAVDSSCTAAELCHHYPFTADKPLRVVPMGVDERFFSTGIAEPDRRALCERYGLPARYFICVGALQPRKNLPFLIDVMAYLRERHTQFSDVMLVLVGRETRQAQGIRARVRECGLDGAVLYLGYVPDDELPVILSGAQALLFPSLHEGFGIPVLEAMASGTPVVAAATGALPEVVGEAGFLLSPTDVAAWVETLVCLLTEPGVGRALRQAGLERARSFTWRSTVLKTVDIYIEMLDTLGHQKC